MSAPESRDDTVDIETNSPFYFNPSHWSAVDGILEGVRERAGLMLLTGPTGSGKTMIMRAISESLEPNTPALFLQYPSLNFREFVNFLHTTLQVEDEIVDAANKAVALREFLYVQAKRDETGVVFIDEAHNLEPDVLRMLPKLSRFDTLEDGRVVGLQFVLIASEELRELMADPDFDAVREKIVVDHTLRFFTRAELKQFLHKRLAPIARVTDEPITEDGIAEMERYTGGSPRLIGMICSHAMLFAAENPGRSIDGAMIREAGEALMLSPIEDAFANEEDRAADAPFSEAEIAGDAPPAPAPAPPADPAPRTETLYAATHEEDETMDSTLRADEDAAYDGTARVEPEDAPRVTDDGDGEELPPGIFDPAAFDRTLDDDFDDEDAAFDDLDEFDDDDDDDDEDASPDGKRSAAVLAGGAAFLSRLGLRPRQGPTKVMGAGRKREKAADAPSAPPPAKRGPRPRVAGARKAMLRKAGIAAAVVAVLGLGYAVHKPVVASVAGLLSGDDPVRTADALPERAAPPPVFAAAPDPAPAAPSARPPGDTVSVDIQNARQSSSGGWGSRVVVQMENAPPLRDSQMSPVIPESVAGVAKGALDLVDRALGAGETGAKSESMGGLFAAASETVADMRGRVTRSGLTPEEATGKALALSEKGAAHFAAGRYIAPVGGNAYDAYREALTLDPDNPTAQAGIASLREHFARKAEGARDAKQWESANSFFEIAIAISNLRAVN